MFRSPLQYRIRSKSGKSLSAFALLIAACLFSVSSDAATLQIQGIEVTQAIQCLDTSDGYTNCPDNSLDIVFGKPTVVRVYMTHDDVACPQGDPFAPMQDYKRVPVTIYWWVLKPGQDPSGILPYQDTEAFDVPCSKIITELRQSKKGSANFVIPIDRFGVPSLQGNVYRLEAEVSGNTQVLTGNVSPPRPPLYVAWAQVDYKPEGYNPPWPGPSLGDFYSAAYAYLLMRENYPVPFSYYVVEPPITYKGPDIRANGAVSRGREVIEAVNAWKAFLEPSPDVAVGWLPPGASGLFGDTLRGGEGGSNSTFCIENTQEKNGACLAHEVGHALGLGHTNLGAPAYYDSCAALEGNLGEVGFDPWRTYWPCQGAQTSSPFCPEGEATKVPPGQQSSIGATDFMNSGGGNWISPYVWNRLLNKPYSLNWSNCEASPSSALAMLTIPLAEPLVPAVVVSGQIASGGLTGTLGPLFHVQSEGPFAISDPSGSYCLDFMSDFDLLSSYCFNLSFMAPETGTFLNTDSFVLKMLFPTGTNSVVLRAGTTVLDQIVISLNAPDVTITSPEGGGTVSDVLNIAWAGLDLDGDPLAYTVLYSRDNGTSFVPLAVNVATTGHSVNSALLAGGQQAFVRVLASDGFNTTSVDSGSFHVPYKPPIVLINAPANNAVISSAKKLMLSGAAQDPQDGELMAASSFSWQGDVAGQLGTGPEVILPADSLSVGTHVISLTAENSGGQTAMASVTVSVTQPPIALCEDVIVSANDQCQATASINNGSSDPDGDYVTIVQNPVGPYSLGATPVALTITDSLGVSDQCIGVVTVQDTTQPVISCNAPPTILASNAPISFTSSATDACSGDPATTITGVSCYWDHRGRRVDKSSSCVVEINGSTIKILDSGGIGNNIDWTVTSVDASGNTATNTCNLLVVKKKK